MRHLILSFAFMAFALCFASTAAAQATQQCPTDEAICAVENGQYLNRVVNGDTTAAGVRARTDRVYQLGRGNIYLMDATIINDENFHLRVYGADGDGALPIIYTVPNSTSGNRVGNAFEMGGDVTFRDFAFGGVIQNPTLNPVGNANMTVTFVRVTQPGADLVIDGVTWVNAHSQFVRAQSALRKFEMTNSIWANSGWLGTNGTNFGAGKGIDLRDGSIDSLIMRNNTFVNYTDRIIRHYASTGSIGDMVFDHNTIVNSVSYHGTLVLGAVGDRVQITNNLFLDSFVAGADTSDIVRQAEFNEHGEFYENGKAKMTWVVAEPNDSTAWVIDNNVWAASSDVEAFYTTYGDGGGDDGNPDNGTDGDNDIIGAGAPLTDHILGQISNPTTAFVEIDDVLMTARPEPMIDMVTWYREETGRTKETATFDAETDDYDRRDLPYFLDTFDASYPTDSPAYTAAAGECPAGDLNWFPTRYEECSNVTVSNEGSPSERLAFALTNHPNPFSAATTIAYELPQAERVSLAVYNVLGQRVATLLDGQRQPAGAHTLRWDGAGESGQRLASGVYIYQLRAGDAVASKRLVVVN